MIEGTVNSDLEAVVTLAVSGPEGQHRDVEAVIDTGYNGLLTLPPALVDELRLPFVTFGHATIADGSEVSYAVFSATVTWDGQPTSVDVDTADIIPLVGMTLLKGHSLHIDVHHGGQVLIEAA